MRQVAVMVDSLTEPGVPDQVPGEAAAAWLLRGDRAAHLLPSIDTVRRAGADDVVIWAGAADVRRGRPIADVVHHVAETIDELSRVAPDSVVTVAAVPHGRGRWAGAVTTLNAELARVARERGVRWLDPRVGRSDDRGRSLASWTNRRGRIRAKGDA